jgi:hypothetical protein
VEAVPNPKTRLPAPETPWNLFAELPAALGAVYVPKAVLRPSMLTRLTFITKTLPFSLVRVSVPETI